MYHHLHTHAKNAHNGFRTWQQAASIKQVTVPSKPIQHPWLRHIAHVEQHDALQQVPCSDCAAHMLLHALDWVQYSLTLRIEFCTNSEATKNALILNTKQPAT